MESAKNIYIKNNIKSNKTMKHNTGEYIYINIGENENRNK